MPSELFDHGMNQSFHSPTPFFPLAIPTASFSLSPDPPNFQNCHTLPHSREITELILLKEAKRHAARKELLTHDCVYYLLQPLPVSCLYNRGETSNLWTLHTSSALPFICWQCLLWEVLGGRCSSWEVLLGISNLAALTLPSTMTIRSLLHEVCAHPFSRILLNLPSCPRIVLASAIPFSVTGF